MSRDKVILKNDWLSAYYNVSHFAFTFAPASYFDNRWHIRMSIPILISLLGMSFISMWFLPLLFIPWGPIYINLPIRSKWDECDPPEYGIAYHDTRIWIYRGVKWWTIRMPWQFEWVRTSLLTKNTSEFTSPLDLLFYTNPPRVANSEENWINWIHETKGRRVDTWKDEVKSLLWKREYSYHYILKSGKGQARIATVGVLEREWRMRWLTWIPLFNKVSRSIDVEFNDEVGERTGSWKGGTLGCGYELRQGESPIQCLRRMEKERIFN